MSLNKWKAWPVENSEDVLKIDKKLVTIPLLPLFFLYFWAVFVFSILWLFLFIFLKFFLHLGAQKKQP